MISLLLFSYPSPPLHRAPGVHPQEVTSKEMDALRQIFTYTLTNTAVTNLQKSTNRAFIISY